MSNYKAIPTKYNGVQYRSRLEARWAMFFDCLGIEYYYEYEGFQLPSGWYVPDFFLPEHGWFEIKPVEPSEEEKRTANELQAELRGNKHPIDINANEIQDYSKSHYILVGFPLKKVFKPNKDTHDINMGYLGETLEGNYWLENLSNGEIYFSINLTELITQQHIEDSRSKDGLILYLDTKQYSCVYCLRNDNLEDIKLIDGTCRSTSQGVSGTMSAMANYLEEMSCWKRYYDHCDSINNLMNVLQQTEDIYNQLIKENRQLQLQCTYRNSKRINDAYQMALKHRFH